MSYSCSVSLSEDCVHSGNDLAAFSVDDRKYWADTESPWHEVLPWRLGLNDLHHSSQRLQTNLAQP